MPGVVSSNMGGWSCFFHSNHVSQLLFAVRDRLVVARLVVFAAVVVDVREGVFLRAVEARAVVFFVVVVRRAVFAFAGATPALSPLIAGSAAFRRGVRVVFAAALPSGEGVSSAARRGAMTSL